MLHSIGLADLILTRVISCIVIKITSSLCCSYRQTLAYPNPVMTARSLVRGSLAAAFAIVLLSSELHAQSSLRVGDWNIEKLSTSAKRGFPELRGMDALQPRSASELKRMAEYIRDELKVDALMVPEIDAGSPMSTDERPQSQQLNEVTLEMGENWKYFLGRTGGDMTLGLLLNTDRVRLNKLVNLKSPPFPVTGKDVLDRNPFIAWISALDDGEETDANLRQQKMAPLQEEAFSRVLGQRSAAVESDDEDEVEMQLDFDSRDDNFDEILASTPEARRQRIRHRQNTRNQLQAVKMMESTEHSASALEPAIPSDRFAKSDLPVKFLSQNWSTAEGHEFYSLRQGSPLMGRNFFDVLEQPDSTDLFRDSTYLASFGFLPRRPHQGNIHGYGTELSDAQQEQPIEFLKTL